MREWDRLRQWLNESRDDIRQERLIAQAAEAWKTNNRDRSYLLSGTRLEQAEAWQQITDLAWTPLESEFIHSSIDEQTALEHAEAERQAHEMAQERRASTLLRALVAVFALAAILSGGFGVFALDQQHEAETERDHAQQAQQEALRQASIGLAAVAEQELEGTNPERGVLIALEALEYYPYTPQALEALARGVEGYRDLRLFDGTPYSANIIMSGEWAPDGTRFAVGGIAAPDSAIVWDATTGEVLLSVEKHQELCDGHKQIQVQALAWSPDSTRIVSAPLADGIDHSCEGTPVVWDANTGETLLVLSGQESDIWGGLAWSQDGSTLSSGHTNGLIVLWDAETGMERLRLQGHTDAIWEVKWSPDNTRIASASEDGTIRIWDAETGQQQMKLTGHLGAVRSVVWSPDGKHLVSGGEDASVRIWDAETGENVRILSAHTNLIRNVDWSQDGRLIMSQSPFDRTIKVWDATSGSFLYQLRNFTARFAAFSPSGNQILTDDYNKHGFVYVWNLPTSSQVLPGLNSPQTLGAFSPDGSFIASGGGPVNVFDADTREQVAELYGGGWGQWSPDSTRVVLITDTTTMGIFDARSGEQLQDFQLRNDMWALTAGWSTDGKYVAGTGWVVGDEYNVQIWDAETGEPHLLLHQDDTGCMAWWPRWSPDASQIITGCMVHERPGSNAPAMIWDAHTGSFLRALGSDYGWTLRTDWSPDGKRIMTSYEEGVVRIWDAETYEPLVTYAGHLDQIWAAAWSPDNTRVASGDLTGLVKIWDAQTGEEYRSFAVPGSVFDISWSPDGREIIVAGEGFNDPIIRRVWEKDELVAYANDCCVTRALTPEERAQFGLVKRAE